MIEGLEARRLLAADVAVSLDNGVLEIIGTNKADVISVALAGGGSTEIDVLVGDQPAQAFPAASVTSIFIAGRGGNDVITIGTGILVPAVVRGDGGHDSITGGDGNDELNGGGGNDTIVGGAGDDTCIGGGGNDTISGDDGDDLLRGDGGNDALNGGAGNDNCDGGAGNDTLNGDDGDDILTGGGGSDTLHGGLGDDDLDGGGGKDNVNGDDGNDRCSGGAGTDSVNGGTGNDIIRGGKGRDNLLGGDGIDAFDDSENRERSSDRDIDDISDISEAISLADLPAAVRDAFTTQFPDAKLIGIERQTEDNGTVYEIEFLGADQFRQRARFDEQGTLLQDDLPFEDNQVIELNELPSAVLSQFNADFPNSFMFQAQRGVDARGVVYTIDFYDAQQFPIRSEYSQTGTQLSVADLQLA